VKTTLLSIGILVALSGSVEGGSAETEPSAQNSVVLQEFGLTLPTAWSASVAESEFGLPDSNVWASNMPGPQNPSDTFPPEELLRTLPARGIVVLVEASIEPEACASTRSLHLAAADIIGGSYEGQPAPHVSSGSTCAARDGRCLFAQAWFGVKDPSEDVLAQVDRILASVQVPGPWPSREQQPSAAGAGLSPAGGSQARGGRSGHVTRGRLLKPLNHATDRKEGAHGGTRGSPVKPSEARARFPREAERS